MHGHKSTTERTTWPRDAEWRRGVFRHFPDGSIEVLCIICEGPYNIHGTIAADLRKADGTMRSGLCASCLRSRRASMAALAKANHGKGTPAQASLPLLVEREAPGSLRSPGRAAFQRRERSRSERPARRFEDISDEEPQPDRSAPFFRVVRKGSGRHQIVWDPPLLISPGLSEREVVRLRWL